MNTTEGVMPPFTPSQWKDLEHQALIFKYMMAGIPVPSDLVLPIQRSMEIPKFFNHSSMGYYPYYGKKVDPEPGRCRRTDGKKWRCAKDAHPDSKYCERHMNRGRSRSRKPVETQNISHCNSTVTSLTPTGGGSQCTAQNNFKDLTHHPAISVSQGNSSLQLQMDSASYEMFNKDYRYPHGTKGEVDDHCLFSEASISARSPEMDSSIDTSHNPSWISIPPSKPRNDSIWPCNYSQVQDLQDLRPTTVTSAMSNQQQYCFFGSEFAAQDPMKPEGQSLRLFCDEWPKSRDSWCDLEDERSNQTLCSATELSMSMPMTASDFSGTGSRSDD